MFWTWVVLCVVGGGFATEQHLASHSVLFIVNGETSNRGRWPWQVSLQVSSGFGIWYHTCGATLITPEFILTAAHCATGYASDYRAWFGAYDLQANDRQDSVFITAIKIHEFYDPTAPGTPNDIALMRLERPVVLSQLVRPVAVPDPGEDYRNAECYITGWGKINGTTGVVPSKLQEARISVISNYECAIFMLDVRNGDINDGHICLYDAQRRTGACQGDSGGPLSCRHTPSSPWQVAGVTSWGVEGCPGTYPSVYTRTSYYKPWIDRVINNKSFLFNSAAYTPWKSSLIVVTWTAIIIMKNTI